MAARDAVYLCLKGTPAVQGTPNPGAAISASGNSGILPLVPNSLQGLTDIVLMVNVSAVPTGGAPTLDVYLQSSCDYGNTWNDIGHCPQFTTSTAVSFMRIAGDAAGPTTAEAQSDAAMAANTVHQGPWGGWLRLKWVFAAGGSSGSYTMAADAWLK